MAEKDKKFRVGNFRFVGELTYKKDSVITDKVLKEGSKYHRKRMSIGVKDSQQNIAYLEMSYIYAPSEGTVKIFGEKPIDIPIKDLTNSKYKDLVPSYQKIILNLIEDEETKKECLSNIYAIKELERKEEQTDEVKAKIKKHKENLEQYKDYYEFIHMDSVIDTLNSYLPKLENKKVVITGQISINYYNKKARLEYKPQQIQLAKEDEENKLEIDTNVFFTNDCMNEDEEAKRIYVSGFLAQRQKKKDKLFPIQLVLDYTKLDPENTLHLQMLNFLKNSLTAEDDESVMVNRFTLRVINSRVEKEFDIDCLTDQQRMMVDLGMATIESFRPRGNIYGERQSEIRIIQPKLLDEFANGGIVAFPTESLAIHLPSDEDDTAPIKEDEVKEEKPKEESKPMDFSSLFGM